MPQEFWSKTSYWRKRIMDNPVIHPDSTKMIEWLFSTTGGLGRCNYNVWTKPIWNSFIDTPRYTVNKNDKLTVRFTNVPIPEAARPAIDRDHSFGIIDWEQRVYFDFWNFWFENDVFWSGAGYKYSLDGDGLCREPSSGRVYTVGGSSTPFLAMAITDEDIRSGVIDHPLGCVVHLNKKGAYVWPPAGRSDGTGTDTYALPMGCRIQLNPDINLEGLGLSTTGKIIARAIQQYGIVVKESGGGWHLYAEHEYSVEGGKWSAFGMADNTVSPLRSLPRSAWRIIDFDAYPPKDSEQSYEIAYVPPMFTCPYCGAVYRTQLELDYHVKAEHEGGYPPLPECYERSFLDYCNTKLNLHVGEPGFDRACDVNQDGVIDIYDITNMGANLCPEKKRTLAASMLPFPLLVGEKGILRKIRNAVASEKIHRKLHPLI